MGFNDHFAKKHSNPNSLLFRRLKRSEQRIVNEFRSHPAAVISDRNAYPAIARGSPNLNAAVLAHSLHGVRENIRDDFLNLVRIEPDLRQVVGERLFKRDLRHSVDAVQRAAHNFIQIYLARA